jgi:alcohol dehydrogenase class IV
MQFEFATAGRILFGAGTVRQAAPAAKEFGRRALLVTGRSPDRVQSLAKALNDASVSCTLFPVESEPTVEMIARGLEAARREECDFVVSFGGGSVIDAGKAIAALLTNPGELMDYLEVIGRGQPLRAASAPFIAIPTTAGTGSEVTRNAVLASHEHRVKVSLRSPQMLPRLAIVDPELTFSLPPTATARSGCDALSQLIEPYVSSRANPLTDGYCLEGLRRVGRSLRRAYHHGDDAPARTDMSLAALLGGLSLANAGLGIVHGFAGPIGGMFDAPHGALCAALLPFGMQANLRALRARNPQSEALSRYRVIAGILTGKPDAHPEDGVEWVRDLCCELQTPSLASYGVSLTDVPVLVEKAARASSTRGNPIELTPEEMSAMLVEAMGNC